jgi:hypothetical protein
MWVLLINLVFTELNSSNTLSLISFSDFSDFVLFAQAVPLCDGCGKEYHLYTVSDFRSLISLISFCSLRLCDGCGKEYHFLQDAWSS